MIDLSKYFNKNVRIIDDEDKKWEGFVETYTPAIDTEDNIEEIAIKTGGQLIGLTAQEIKSIEIIKAS